MPPRGYQEHYQWAWSHDLPPPHEQVLFNIGGPALNQLQNAANKQKSPGFKKAQKAVSKAVKRRAVTGAIAGLSAASLLAAAPQADAAQELAQLAAG